MNPRANEWHGVFQPIPRFVPFLLLGDEPLALEAQTQDPRFQDTSKKNRTRSFFPFRAFCMFRWQSLAMKRMTFPCSACFLAHNRENLS
jgi:hypothetical protein